MKIDKGKIEIRIFSLNHGKIIDMLKKQKVVLYNCKREYKLLTFIINCNDFPKVEELLNKSKLEYVVGKKYGLLPKLREIISRLGIWIGAVMVVLSIVFYSLTYFNFVIVGIDNEIYTLVFEKVKGYTDAVGIKSQLDVENLTKAVESVDGISKATVYFSGAKLVIDCLPSLDYPYDIEKNSSPIISAYDCIVSKILLESGYSRVKIGDTIKKGDLLISSEYLGEEEKPTEPTIGKVYGRCWMMKKIVINPFEVVKKRTGRVFKSRSWYIGNSIVYEGKKPPYSVFEKESKKICLFGILPITIVVESYYELDADLLEIDMDAREEEMTNLAITEFQKELKDGDTPIRWWKISKPLDKIREISIYYEVEREVSYKDFKTEKNA